MKASGDSVFINFGNFDPPIRAQITETQFEQLQTNNRARSQTNIIAEGIPPEGPYIQVGAIYVPIITTLSQSNIATTTNNNANTSAPLAVEPALIQLPLLSLVHPNTLEDMATVNYPRGNIVIILINNEQNVYPWNTYLQHDQNSYNSNPSYQTLADGESNFNQLLTIHSSLYHLTINNPAISAVWQSNGNNYQQMLDSLRFDHLLRTNSESYQTQSHITEMVTVEAPRYSTVFTFNPFHNFPSYETFAANYGTNAYSISLYQTLNTHWTDLRAISNPHGTVFMDQPIIADGTVIHHEVDYSGAHLNPFSDN